MNSERSFKRDLNTLRIDRCSLMRENYAILESLLERAGPDTKIMGAGNNGQEFSGSGIKKTVPCSALIQKRTQSLATVECKSRILNILGDINFFKVQKEDMSGKKRKYSHSNIMATYNTKYLTWKHLT